MRTMSIGVSLTVALAASASCSGEETVNPLPTTTASAGTGGSGGSGGSLLSVGGRGTSLTSGSETGSSSGGAEPCVQEETTATLSNKPIDIIFVIDNSGSMGGEIEEVEVQINKTFANIINDADPPIDYRVIMIASWGC